MRITHAAEAPIYHPPLHDGVQARRLQGEEAGPTENFWVGLSSYPPGSSAQQSTVALETVYVVLGGTLTLTSDGVDHEVSTHDSVHLPPGTVRSVENRSDAEATLLVIVTRPKQPS